jgi:hypothetical protein
MILNPTVFNVKIGLRWRLLCLFLAWLVNSAKLIRIAKFNNWHYIICIGITTIEIIYKKNADRCSREPLQKGNAQYSTVHLLVWTSLDQLLLILQNFISFLQNSLNEEVNCTEPSPSVSVPRIFWQKLNNAQEWIVQTSKLRIKVLE